MLGTEPWGLYKASNFLKASACFFFFFSPSGFDLSDNSFAVRFEFTLVSRKAIWVAPPANVQVCIVNWLSLIFFRPFL